MSLEHEACLYRELTGFVDAARPFVEEGVSAGEAVLVAVSAPQIDALRRALGATDGVVFADMAVLGRNPMRIISVWREFVRDNTLTGRGFRGIGEPVWAGRGAAELVECQRHEALLNLAFADGPCWRLMCPYDVGALAPAVIDEALASHPVVGANGVRLASDRYRRDFDRFDEALPDPPGDAVEVVVTVDGLATLRDVVAAHASAAGLHPDRAAELLFAVHEVAGNSIRHGGGRGLLRAWIERDTVMCEISDNGWVPDPLVGRRRPPAGARRGRGLWLVNEWCDLVQWRSSFAGTVIRVHMTARPPHAG